MSNSIKVKTSRSKRSKPTDWHHNKVCEITLNVLGKERSISITNIMLTCLTEKELLDLTKHLFSKAWTQLEGEIKSIRNDKKETYC